MKEKENKRVIHNGFMWKKKLLALYYWVTIRERVWVYIKEPPYSYTQCLSHLPLNPYNGFVCWFDGVATTKWEKFAHYVDIHMRALRTPDQNQR